MKAIKQKKILSILMASLMIFSNSLIDINAMDNYDDTKIDKLEDYTELYGLNKKKVKSSKSLKTTGKINNIAVFIEFPDQTSVTINDSDTRAKAEEVFNTGGINDSTYGKIPLVSLNEYLEYMSYGKLDVKTSIYPKKNPDDTNVISYVTSKPRTYFMKKSNLAPDGYANVYEQNDRERELLEGALNHVKSQIEEDFNGDDLDTNDDGYIDAISFFVEGKYGTSQGIGFQDLLWPHKADGYFGTKIDGKSVSSYNLVTTGDPNEYGGVFSKKRTAYGVIVHEFLHVLGLPDLYRVSQIGDPVGQWSMMATNGSQTLNPLTAFYQNEYLNWGSKLETIGSGTHKVVLEKPKYNNPNEKRAIKIKSPLNENEYFVVEFRKKEGFDKYTNMDHSGIIVYRINNKFSISNGNKIEDFMYIFRPGETGLGDGNGELNKATFSLESGRTSFGKETSDSSEFDNGTIHYSDGTNSGIVISNVSSGNEDTITFDVKVPSIKGSGTASDPYIISKPADLNLVKGQSKAHFKMTNDIDMSGINNFEGLGVFRGNFDGQGYKIKNLTIEKNSSSESAALFDIIDWNATVKNLVFENVNVVNTSGRAASLVGTASGNINNIKVNSGKVEGSKSGGTDASGGLIAYSTDTANISNSYSRANVVGSGNVGGLIGINSNSKIENTYSTGSVSKKESSDNVGGFIGENLLMGGTNYIPPKNSYFDIRSSKQADGIGSVKIWGFGSIGGTGKEGVVGVKVDNEILLEIPNTPSKKINLTTTTSETLNGAWTSQNQSIATVSNGVVTAKSKGATKVLYSLPVGTNNMVFTTNVTVENNSIPIENEKPVITAKDVTIKARKSIDLLKDSRIGLNAIDKEEGNITNKVTVKNTGGLNSSNPSKGVYTVVYTVKDNHGNIVDKSIKVTVVSNDAPIINGIKNKTIKLKEVDAFNKTGKLNGVTVSDDHDKISPSAIKVEGVVGKPKAKTNQTYNLTYTVTDSDGNKTKIVRKITVTNEVPVISGLSEISIIKGKTKDIKAGVKARDKEDGDLTKKIVYPKTNLATLKAGTHKIEYLVKDSDGNTTKATRTVKVLNTFSTFTVNSIKKTDSYITGKGLKNATVKAYVSGKEVGRAKVASNGTYKIKLKSKIANGKQVVLKMSYSGYATKEISTKVLNTFSTFTVNKVSYKDLYITGKGLKSAEVKIYNGKTLVGKGTVSSKGVIKVKLTKKQKKNAKLTVKMSKSGYATVEKSVTVR